MIFYNKKVTNFESFNLSVKPITKETNRQTWGTNLRLHKVEDHAKENDVMPPTHLVTISRRNDIKVYYPGITQYLIELNSSTVFYSY